ncbi:hypothetical protein [Phytohabitans kaempferiae]|uniref:Uncharacterized protein n=1 Tax=Phytohabitans kaempferiae TaxID=1620943 RepID=A0ABV6M826_9ACTN
MAAAARCTSTATGSPSGSPARSWNATTREGGGAVFFVSNDRTGSLKIENSTLRRNPSDGFETLPGIFYLGTAERPSITGPKPS